MPAGLSTRRTAPSGQAPQRRRGSASPFGLSLTELSGDLATEELDELVVALVAPEAGGAPVPAPALAAGDHRDVDRAVGGAQADLARRAPAVGLVADHGRHGRALEAADEVDDALREHLLGTRGRVVLDADVGDREPVVVEALDLLQGPRDQVELLDRHPLVEAAVDVVDVDPGVDQVGRHPMRGRPGVLVHEHAGVGHQADVERGRDLRGDLGAEQPGELEDDLRRARDVGVDQVDGAEAGVVVVVVDVDQPGARALQELDRHPVDVAAVEEDERAVDDVGGRLVEDLLERQEAVLDRQRELLRGQEHHRVLAELLEDVVHRQQRAERVAVRALVGGEQEAVGRAQLVDDEVEIVRGRGGGGLTHIRRLNSGAVPLRVTAARPPAAC